LSNPLTARTTVVSTGETRVGNGTSRGKARARIGPDIAVLEARGRGKVALRWDPREMRGVADAYALLEAGAVAAR
jgi:hypothetical protein